MPSSGGQTCALPDRKSTRLNSSHTIISDAVFCLEKKQADDGDVAHISRAARARAAAAEGLALSARARPLRARRLLRARASASGRTSFFFLTSGRPPSSPLFPYRALFR